VDEQLQQLEQELKRLHPAAPPSVLRERIRRALQPEDSQDVPVPARRRSWAGAWWWIVALPAAAAVAVMLTQRSTPPAADTAARPEAVARRASGDAVFKPVQAENILYAASNEGLITLEDGTPARRERLHYVDTITWRNPRTNASLTWSVPREEVRVVPVELH
jgi:hypothetical protein